MKKMSYTINQYLLLSLTIFPAFNIASCSTIRKNDSIRELPLIRIGHFSGWSIAIEDLDNDVTYEIIVYDRWEKQTTVYKWKTNAFKSISSEISFPGCHKWYDVPGREILPAKSPLALKLKNLIPQNSEVLKYLKADIDADKANEIVVLAGKPKKKFDCYYNNLFLAIFEPMVNKDQYFLKIILELSETQSLIEGGNFLEPLFIKLLKVKGKGERNQLVVCWVNIFGSGHEVTCEIFDVTPDIRLKEYYRN